MIDVLEECQRLLNGSDIATSSLEIAPGRNALAFEGVTVLGFIIAYPGAGALLERWRPDDAGLISQHQLSFRRAQAKAWNAYSVFLAAEPANYGELVALNAIEENLTGTRKIARAGIADVGELRAALLPLLPIQHAPSLEPVDMPAEIRLRTSELPERAVDAFLSAAQEAVVIQVLEEEP
jgi:hypothetical protein